MASHAAKPVVKSLPKIVITGLVYILFVAGHIVLWNDRRVSNVRDKTIAVPVYK